MEGRGGGGIPEKNCFPLLYDYREMIRNRVHQLLQPALRDLEAGGRNCATVKRGTLCCLTGERVAVEWGGAPTYPPAGKIQVLKGCICLTIETEIQPGR